MGTDFWTSQIKNEDNAEDSPRRIAMMELSPIGSPERSPEDGPEGSPEDDSDSDTTTTKSPAVTPDFIIGSKRSLIQRQNFPLRRFISEVVKTYVPFIREWANATKRKGRWPWAKRHIRGPGIRWLTARRSGAIESSPPKVRSTLTVQIQLRLFFRIL